jgi:hypothetical protein
LPGHSHHYRLVGDEAGILEQSGGTAQIGNAFRPAAGPRRLPKDASA